jgi:3',5'-cyclic-nucleotide phosphodiesterase
MNGVDKGCSYYLKSDHAYIGRSLDNDIPLNDIFVSRKHLKVQRREGSHFIQDLLSRNGTYLNGQRIQPGLECKIRDGDRIAIGGTLILWEQGIPAGVETVHDMKALAEKSNVILLKTEEANLNQKLLHEISDLLQQSHAFGELLAKILDCLFAHFVQIDRCAFILVDAETKKVFEVASKAKSRCDDNLLRYSRAVVNRVLRSGKAVMMSNIFAQDGVELSWSMELMKIDAAMCVPLIGKGETKGVIYLDCLRQAHAFRVEDLSTLSALSTLLSLALERGYGHPNNPFTPRKCELEDHEAQGVGARVRSMFETMSHGVVSLSKRCLYH